VLNRAEIKMTECDREVLELLANESMSNKEIAERVGMAEGTVKHHLRSLYLRAGLLHSQGRKRVQLAALLRPAQEKQLVRVPLTKKEWEIAGMVAEGVRNVTIAQRLGNSHQVIRNYLRGIYNKTGVWSRLELAAWVEAHHQDVEAHGR
jgi:DNA-binding NarL/FixJ family response regulator